MKVGLSALALAVGLLSLSTSLGAHHSWPVTYSNLVTVKGTVTAVSWVNPHPMISLDVASADGKVEKWSVGDAITGTGYQFADGQKIVRLERVVLPDGKEMRVYAR